MSTFSLPSSSRFSRILSALPLNGEMRLSPNRLKYDFGDSLDPTDDEVSVPFSRRFGDEKSRCQKDCDSTSSTSPSADAVAVVGGVAAVVGVRCPRFLLKLLVILATTLSARTRGSAANDHFLRTGAARRCPGTYLIPRVRQIRPTNERAKCAE